MVCAGCIVRFTRQVLSLEPKPQEKGSTYSLLSSSNGNDAEYIEGEGMTPEETRVSVPWVCAKMWEEMMGEDWEEFAKKYFDAAGLDHATNNTTSGRNGHLGGNQQQTNNHNSKSAEWEDWMKGMMFGFVSFVAGQDVTNRFQHSTSSFKFQQPFANGAASDGTRK